MSHDSTTTARFCLQRGYPDKLASRKEGIEINNSSGDFDSNTPISSAYIRSLVKQLSSSSARRTRRDGYIMAMGSRRDRDSGDRTARSPEAEEAKQQQQSNSGPPSQKKQVRRRLHTTRPYQERLLNMAEARREIVAALKFHRATMKHAQQKQQQHENQNQPLLAIPQPLHRPALDCVKFDLSSVPFSAFSSNPQHPHNPSLSFNQNPYSWPVSPLPSSSPECLDLALPSQTLGLNLNVRHFDNLYHKGSTTPPSSVYSTSTSSQQSSSISSAVTVSHDEARLHKLTAATMVGEAAQEDEETRSLVGRHHQMAEWNEDGMNLVKSAWRLEYLKKGMEGDEEAAEWAAEERSSDGSDGFRIFDEVMEFPPWLGGGESCLQPHLVDDCSSDEYFQDATLP